MWYVNILFAGVFTLTFFLFYINYVVCKLKELKKGKLEYGEVLY